MKTLRLSLVLILLTVHFGYSQGTVNFNNRATSFGSGAQSPVVAPIFGFDVANPTQIKQGNPGSSWNGTSGPTPVPLGTQTYGGAPLTGTGYTVSLWAAPADAPDSQLVQVAQATFRTSTTISFKGFWEAPTGPVVVVGVPSAPGVFAKFQIKAWDNRGGTLTSWEQVLADNNTALGWSTIFIVPYQLGDHSVAAPNLLGLESFELYPVPEPSVFSIAAVGVLLFVVARTRRLKSWA